MNAVYPLRKSVLMDYVDKDRRAKWASLESLTSFGWSGSAVLGGYLVEYHGYDACFFVTATSQLVSLLIRLPLLRLVPRAELFAELRLRC